jgi:HSP20 family molecular chaperone IbpA
MKKPSFFERLAGNLRFDDTDDIAELKENKKETLRSKEHREITINSDEDSSEKKVSSARPEEVGELPVDVYETPNEIIIQTLIAGVMPEHLSIDITRDVVSIRGKREESKGVPNDAYHVRELYWGAFERIVDLPEEIEIDNAEAIERHGMLMIKLPKVDKKRRTVLKIKSI